MSLDAAAAASANEPAPIEISVLRGNPTEDELAALIAVVTEAYDAEVVGAVADDTPPASAWA
ncbi:MAG TPA: acyl-CoA carboxylase subunit epsilon, partial [Microbacteriaceae bacterium]|nr:acyl-CoA carboxylase subunit epsilon [Microbacteriaceae bacterium]